MKGDHHFTRAVAQLCNPLPQIFAKLDSDLVQRCLTLFFRDVKHTIVRYALRETLIEIATQIGFEFVDGDDLPTVDFEHTVVTRSENLAGQFLDSGPRRRGGFYNGHSGLSGEKEIGFHAHCVARRVRERLSVRCARNAYGP